MWLLRNSSHLIGSNLEFAVMHLEASIRLVCTQRNKSRDYSVIWSIILWRDTFFERSCSLHDTYNMALIALCKYNMMLSICRTLQYHSVSKQVDCLHFFTSQYIHMLSRKPGLRRLILHLENKPAVSHTSLRTPVASDSSPLVLFTIWSCSVVQSSILYYFGRCDAVNCHNSRLTVALQALQHANTFTFEMLFESNRYSQPQ